MSTQLGQRPFDKIKMTRGRGRWPKDFRKLGWFSCALYSEKSVRGPAYKETASLTNRPNKRNNDAIVDCMVLIGYNREKWYFLANFCHCLGWVFRDVLVPLRNRSRNEVCDGLVQSKGTDLPPGNWYREVHTIKWLRILTRMNWGGGLVMVGFWNDMLVTFQLSSQLERIWGWVGSGKGFQIHWN